jgi:hypothetical protein
MDLAVGCCARFGAKLALLWIHADIPRMSAMGGKQTSSATSLVSRNQDETTRDRREKAS